MGTSRWKENIFELLKGPHSEFNRLQTIERNCFQFLVLKGCEMHCAYSLTVVLHPYIDGTEYPNETPAGYRKQVLR